MFMHSVIEPFSIPGSHGTPITSQNTSSTIPYCCRLRLFPNIKFKDSMNTFHMIWTDIWPAYQPLSCVFLSCERSIFHQTGENLNEPETHSKCLNCWQSQWSPHVYYTHKEYGTHFVPNTFTGHLYLHDVRLLLCSCSSAPSIHVYVHEN